MLIKGQSLSDQLKFLAYAALFLLIAVISFSISLFEIVSITFILLSAASYLLSDKKKPFFNRTMIVWIGLYFTANLLSFTQTEHLADSLKGIFRIFRLILLTLSVIYVVDDQAKLKAVLGWFACVAAAIGIDALIQGATGFELIRQRRMIAYIQGTDRITGPFKHANDFAGYLSFAIFLFFGKLLSDLKGSRSKYFNLVWCAGALILGICLLKTYSRGAWVAVAISLFIFLVLKKNRAAFAVFAGVLVWALFFSPPILKERMRSLWDPKNGTIIERKILMGESLEMLKKSPYFGLGLNTYSANAPLYKSKEARTDVQYAHNGYVQMAAEIGLVGLFSFLALLFYFFYSTLPAFFKNRLPDETALYGQALCAAVFSFLIHSATDTNLHSVLLVSLLWLGLGLGWAAKRVLAS